MGKKISVQEKFLRQLAKAKAGDLLQLDDEERNNSPYFIGVDKLITKVTSTHVFTGDYLRFSKKTGESNNSRYKIRYIQKGSSLSSNIVISKHWTYRGL